MGGGCSVTVVTLYGHIFSPLSKFIDVLYREKPQGPQLHLHNREVDTFHLSCSSSRAKDCLL